MSERGKEIDAEILEWTRNFGAGSQDACESLDEIAEPDRRRIVRGKRNRRKKKISYRADPELKGFNLERMIEKRMKNENISERWMAIEGIVKKMPESPVHRAKVYATVNRMLNRVLELDMNRLALYRGQYDDERVDTFGSYTIIQGSTGEEDEFVWTKQEGEETRMYVKHLSDVFHDYYWNNRRVMRSSSLTNSVGSKLSDAMLPDQDEILPLWVNVIRTHAFVFMEHCFTCKTSGEQLPALSRLIETGSDGGCLVDLHTPVMDYPLTLLFKAIESLHVGWRELQYSEDLWTYVNLLFSRYAILSVSMFTDRSSLDREDMIDVEELTEEEHGYQRELKKKMKELSGGTRIENKKEEEYKGEVDEVDVIALEAEGQYRVNETFFEQGDAVLGSIKRELMTHLMLVDFTQGKYLEVSPEEADSRERERLLGAYRDWAVQYVEGARATAILQLFRDNLVGELVRPGERERFRMRWPTRDPNDTNIVSRLRPKDIERYRKNLMEASMKDVIMGTKDFNGMHTGRNELAFSVIRYYTEECLDSSRLDGLFIRRRGLSDPEDIKEIGWDPVPPVIVQSLGCYMVWCPWDNSAVSVHHFPIAVYLCCRRYLEDFDSIIWPKWAYVHDDDEEDGVKKDDEDTQRILIEWKLDRFRLLKDVFNVEWNDAL